ncbi:MAG: hypothetical protein KTR19_05175 [Hyphomicrobiales bacterium]|nr:hypothetical protein [Hyphomicrobiales bacterium]
MTNSKTKRPPPLSLRLTPDERRQLEDKAAGMSLGGYIRACLFSRNGPGIKNQTCTKTPVKDHKALAEVLAKLGASRFASNLNQLAKAANMGALPLSPEVEEELMATCAAVIAIRAELMKALGYPSDDSR